MKSLAATCLAIILALTSVARGEMSISWYQENKDANPARVYISGVAVGISWANTALDAGSQLYCPPEKLALTVDNYVSILDAYIANRNPGASDPLEMHLLKSLMQAFPC